MRTRTWVAVVALAGLLAAPGMAVAEETVDVSGAWTITWQTRQGERTMTANFEQDGEKLTGALVGPQGRSMPLNGSVKGDSIKFTVQFETQRGDFEVTYKGKVEGDTMKGKAQTPQAAIDWSGQRKQ